MKLLSRHIILLFSVLLLAACTDEFPVEKSPQQYILDGDYYFVLADESEPTSRLQYDGILHSEFTTGDRIGIFAPQNADKTQIPNDVFTARDMTDNPPSGPHQVLVPCDDEIKKEVPEKENEYLLYYPYVATQSLTGVSNGDMKFTVKEEQKTEANLKASDLLWCHKLLTAEEKEAQYITIHMNHAMANIVIKVSKDSVDTDHDVTLLSIPTEATGIKLRYDDGATEMSLERMSYGINPDSKKDITMFRLPDDTDEYNYVYRAIVPACQTVTKDTDIFTLFIKNKTDEFVSTTYKLAQDIEFRPGKYYTFNLRSGQKPVVPEVGDDDSWVYDILDEKGDPVGLLCREYIYWAPAEKAANYRGCPVDNPGDYTFKMGTTNLSGGTNGCNNMTCMISTCPASEDLLEQINNNGEYSMSIDNMFPAINSQAWVFYNLQSNGQPDLTKGTILRFVYDIKSAGGQPGYTPYLHPRYSHISTTYNHHSKMAWPYPHLGTGGERQGIFKVAHGHDYIASNEIGLTGDKDMYGLESKEYLEYYMHGGVITWDATNNIIDKFFMPEEKITNNLAFVNGHIAIRIDENGQKTAFVSYTPCVNETLDEDGYTIGQRRVKTMTIGEKTYPLRKVGFNQFWSGKSLSSTTDNEGNKLECFNVTGNVGAVNYSPFYTTEPEDDKKYDQNAILPPGYIYPTAIKGQQDQNGAIHDSDFDPYADPSLRGSVALLYSFASFTEGKLKPTNTVDESYRFPTVGDMIKLRRYGGVLFAAKWITDHIRTKLPDGTYLESTYEGLKNGMLLKNDSYCANISGLDFRAFGMKGPKDDHVIDLGNRNYFYLDATTDFPYAKDYPNAMGDPDQLDKDPMAWIEIFQFSPWHCWGSNSITDYINGTHTIADVGANWKKAHSRTFAPIRVIMSFTNPIGNGASSAEMEYMSRSMPKAKSRADNESKIVNVRIVKSESEK